MSFHVPLPLPPPQRLKMALKIFGVTASSDGISETKYRRKNSFRISSAKNQTLGSNHFQNSRQAHVLIHACGIEKETCMFSIWRWARNQQSELSALKWTRLANNLAWTGVCIVHSRSIIIITDERHVCDGRKVFGAPGHYANGTDVSNISSRLYKSHGSRSLSK